jgi:NAD(P)-dependent dehydrogenase (short-subunit alcohol dehydrogenase family)
MLFDNVRVLVTGGTRGIGKAISLKLLNEGAEVVITGRSDTDSCWCNESVGCSYHKVDFSDKIQLNDFCREIEKESFTRLVNNAGIFRNLKSLGACDDFEAVQQVNVMATNAVTNAFARKINIKDKGRVVNISSIASFVTRKGVSAYATSKAALSGLTRAQALDFADLGILVNAVCPSYTETDMLYSLSKKKQAELLEKVPLGRFCKAEEIAELTSFLLSEENTYITGQNLIIDGGVTIK